MELTQRSRLGDAFGAISLARNIEKTELFFVVVGFVYSIAFVHVEASTIVAELVKAIVMKARYLKSLPAPRIELFLAKIDGWSWLTFGDSVFKKLQQPDFPRDSLYLKARSVRPTLRSRHYFPSDIPTSRVIHLLEVSVVGVARRITQVRGTFLH